MTTKKGEQASLKYFRVIWEERDTVPELILRVNRQLSKATQRNRIKRIVREFFRKSQKVLGRGCWVFIARQHVEEATNKEIFDDLERTLTKFCHKDF